MNLKALFVQTVTLLADPWGADAECLNGQRANFSTRRRSGGGKGRKGKGEGGLEGGLEGGRPAGAGSRGRPDPPSAALGAARSPSPAPARPGEGGNRGEGTRGWDADKCALG